MDFESRVFYTHPTRSFAHVRRRHIFAAWPDEMRLDPLTRGLYTARRPGVRTLLGTVRALFAFAHARALFARIMRARTSANSPRTTRRHPCTSRAHRTWRRPRIFSFPSLGSKHVSAGVGRQAKTTYDLAGNRKSQDQQTAPQRPQNAATSTTTCWPTTRRPTTGPNPNSQQGPNTRIPAPPRPFFLSFLRACRAAVVSADHFLPSCIRDFTSLMFQVILFLWTGMTRRMALKVSSVMLAYA